MASRHIPDSRITSSSVKDDIGLAKFARPDLAGWTAERNNINQWIKVDIFTPTEVRKKRGMPLPNSCLIANH